jgi:hypothetical protein
MSLYKFVLPMIALFGLAACANTHDPGERALGGALIGGGTGAVIGGVTGGPGGAAAGAAIGGVGGAAAGVLTTPGRY